MGVVVAEFVPDTEAADLAQVAERIRGRETAVRAGAVAYLHNGLDLIEAKRRLDHGAFGPWCEREFHGTLGWSQKSIERMMSAAEFVGTKIDKLSNLGIGRSTVYRVAEKATPDPIKNAFLAGIEAGDGSAGKTALAAIREAKDDPKCLERKQALSDLAALLRKRLRSDRNRFADLAERAGIDLRALPELLKQDSDKPTPRRSRHVIFEGFQAEMFPSQVATAPTDTAEPGLMPAPAEVT